MKQKHSWSRRKFELSVISNALNISTYRGGLARALTTVSWESCWCGWSGPGLVLGVCNGGADAEVIKRCRDENDYLPNNLLIKLLLPYFNMPWSSVAWFGSLEDSGSGGFKTVTSLSKRAQTTEKPWMMQLLQCTGVQCTYLWVPLKTIGCIRVHAKERTGGSETHC